MRRGEIWTSAGGGDYAGKPRPVVILQADEFDATNSITVCGLTTNPVEAPFARLIIEPNETNGLDAPSRVMVDKITTIRRTRLHTRVGQLDDAEIAELNDAILVFLGLAEPPRRRRRRPAAAR